MIILVLSAAAAAQRPEPAASAAASAARATVRVLHAVRASQADWDRGGARHAREVIVKQADGRMIRLRLTEFE